MSSYSPPVSVSSKAEEIPTTSAAGAAGAGLTRLALTGAWYDLNCHTWLCLLLLHVESD